MLSMPASMAAGAAAGAAHVISGPDHLAALAPMSVHNPRKAFRTGAAWGMGHGLGVLGLGGLGQLAKGHIDVQNISAVSELTVGFLLIGIGLWALHRAHRLQVHSHQHTHDGHPHHHIHIHGNESEHTGHSHAAFWVGALHGTAGGGHLLGVLPSLALPPAQAAGYLLTYLVAAVASMTGFSVALGRLSSKGSPATLRRVLQLTAVASVLIGAVWIGIGLNA